MPTISLDDTYEPRPWACDECKHLLGVVMRDTNRVRRLWIFRSDFDCTMPSAAILMRPPRGLFKVHGIDQAHGVECGNCGALNEWTISKESYLRLISYYGQAK
jgi:hypothetical protein